LLWIEDNNSTENVGQGAGWWARLSFN
jgi:hypothetical protein